MDRTALFGIGEHDADVFSDSATGDVLAFTTRSNQRFLFGTKINDPAGLQIASDHVAVSTKLGVGTSEPAVSLDIVGTDALALPIGCNQQRPSEARLGMIRYNTELEAFEGLGAGCNWTSLGGVIDIDRDTFVRASNDNSLQFFASNAQKMDIDYERVKIAGFLSITTDAFLNCNLPIESSGASFWNKNASNDLYYLPGRVGLGKSDPRTVLDVAGTVSASQYSGGSQGSPLVVGGTVLPASNLAYDLGTSNYRFRDLFLSGTTIHLGGQTLSTNASNEIVVDGVFRSTQGFKLGDVPVIDSSGLLSGNGSNLTDLGAKNIAWGTVDSARLPLESSVSSFCNDRVATADSVRLAYSNADGRLPLAGGTIAGNLAVTGNFTVSGTTTTVDTETLLIKDNLILLNSSNMPLSGSVSGIEISRGADSNYQFVFVEDTESFKVGTTDSLQAVATRPDSIVDRSVPFWDILENWLAFDSNVKISSAGTLSATLFDGSGSNLRNLNAGEITFGTISNVRTTATSSNIGNTIVCRDSLGGFEASNVTATQFIGIGSNLSSLNAGSISWGILSNDRTTATALNTAGAIVARDASGNFSASNITATGLGVLGDVALSGANRYVGTTTNHSLALRTSNTDRITVLPNGNVGLGTVNPQVRLTVDGSARLLNIVPTSRQTTPTLSTLLSNGGVNLVNSGDSGDGVMFGLLESIQTSNGNTNNPTGYIQAYWDSTLYGTSQNTAFCLNPYGGNVGIGTVAPGSLLDLLGNLTFGQNNLYNGRAVFRTFGGNVTGTPTSFIDTGIRLYSISGEGGGGGILLFVSTQTSNGGSTSIFLFYIRKYYDAILTWSSSSTTVATIVSIGVTGVSPQNFSVTGNNTLQFNFNSAANYRCVAMDF